MVFQIRISKYHGFDALFREEGVSCQTQKVHSKFPATEGFLFWRLTSRLFLSKYCDFWSIEK
jgi:hypothetical protein